MTKKPDYQLEYVYPKSRYKKVMWWSLGIYIALRIIRAILYFTVGTLWLSGIPAAFIFFFSGFFLGIVFAAIYLYRRSVRVSDIEDEKDRLSQK